ncbi:MAG TPA: hypothetical protein VF267_02330 [Gammaproteobacteria bacterium]
MNRPQRNRFLLLAATITLSGCAATVVPPASPGNPRPAFILDHGRHASLVVVDNGGRPVRYAFGQPGASGADGDIGFFRGLGALLVPESGTLGRRVLPGLPTAGNVRMASGVDVENVYCIAVAGERANRLQRVLNLVFEDNLASATYDPDWNLEFVENPADYWFGDDPNEAVENWLVELGCEVSGVTSFGDWKIRRPSGELPPVCAAAMRQTGSR